MDNILKTIVDKHIPCYFISPHFDDAVLSAGGLLSYLSTKTKVTLVTAFTEAIHGPYTFLMKRFLLKTGYKDAVELYEQRKYEDAAVCASLGLTQIQLGFIEGSLRKRKRHQLLKALERYLPELHHLYPLGRTVIRLAKEDKHIEKEIAAKIETLLEEDENFVLFCPIGTVSHMDHTITRNACLSLEEKVKERTLDLEVPRLIFWTDYPYIKDNKVANKFIKQNNLTSYHWNTHMIEKRNLISLYKSQIKSIFKNGTIPDLPETFYFER